MKNENLRVLLVDDDAINITVFEKFLSEFRIKSVTNGRDALDMVKRETFDVILMDINLGTGQMNGVEVMHEMKKDPALHNVKIFAVTSYSMREDRDKFINEGFDNYFSKPFNHSEIIKAIKATNPNQVSA